MNKFIFTFIICLSLSGWAFEFKQEQCLITSKQTIQFSKESESFESKVQMDLFFSSNQIPIIRMTFLTHSVPAAAISWPDAELSNNQRAYFTSDLEKWIRQFNQQSLDLNLITSTSSLRVFETNAENPLQAQMLTALFLTQNNLTLILKSDSGSQWNGKLSLKSSDSSYRKLVSTCFPQKSALYLKEDGSRKKIENVPETLNNNAPAFSTGYGLLDSVGLMDLLPAQIPLENFENPAIVFNLLQQKQAIVNRFSQVSTDVAFQKASEEVAVLMNEQKVLSARLTLLSTGETADADSLIEKNKTKQLELETQIVEIEKQIKKMQEGLISLRTQNSTNEEKLKPYWKPLEEISQLTKIQEEKVQSLEAYLKDIAALLQTYKNQLPADLFAQAETLELSPAPWSLEEIDKKNKELQGQIQSYRILESMEASLAQLKINLSSLSSASEKIDELTQTFLDVSAQKSKTEQAIKDKDVLIQKMQQVPFVGDFEDIHFLTILSFTEDKAAKSTRNYDDESRFHETQFNALSVQYKDVIKTLTPDVKWASFICDWPTLAEKHFNHRSLNCLVMTDFLNDRKREDFLNQLSPQLLDQMIDISTSPWTLDTSKIEYLSEKISKDISLNKEKIERALEIEQLIRVYVWRWNSQQLSVEDVKECNSTEINNMIKNESFSKDFYESIFYCEKKKLSKMIVDSDTLFNQTLSIGINITETKNKLQEAQNKWNTDSLTFVNSAQQLFESSQEAMSIKDSFMACFDVSMGLGKCQKSFKKQEEFQENFVINIKELNLQIASRTKILEVDLKTAQQELQDLTLRKEKFIQENGLEELMTTKDSLSQQLKKTQDDLIAIQKTIHLKNQNLKSTIEEYASLEQEASQIIAKVALLSLQVENIQQGWTTECAGFLQIKAEIDALDSKILSLVKSSVDLKNAATPQSPFLILCTGLKAQ